MKRLLCALLLGLLVTSVAASADERADEIHLGRVVYNDLVKKRQIVYDSPYSSALQAVGARISRAAQPHWFSETFYVVRGNQANAYSAPGGYVFVNEGLLRAVINADELASVLGHETGHLVLGHVTANRSQQKKETAATNLGKKIKNFFGGKTAQSQQTSDQAFDAATKTAHYGLMNFSRQQELAADQKGADLAAAAGYNPWGTVWFFRRIQRTEGDAGFEQYVQRHPTISERIKRIESYFKDHPSRFKRYSPTESHGSGLPMN